MDLSMVTVTASSALSANASRLAGILISCAHAGSMAAANTIIAIFILLPTSQANTKHACRGDALILLDGLQSPKNLPMARSPFTLSQTALNAAVIGIASSNPGASHRNPQIISENVTASGFKCTRDPTILGYSRFSASKWNTVTIATTSRYPEIVLYAVSPTNSGGSTASGNPTYGTRLRNPLSGPTSSA